MSLVGQFAGKRAAPFPAFLAQVNLPGVGGGVATGDRPVFVASLERGNRLCWHDRTEWRALPAPDGALRAACASGGAVRVRVGREVWSVEDPTGS